ncbi:MMPL family transporter [Streptantibioticus ferralitis]|uniref:MMPL family transporter n=1 Tax=Streptantibioticus ferralitis TaxID=236510 RepID=A0ABT5YWP3_9ACTN|nr:MMPL family transporter [Streptantibioticus ferralitis]MDF2256028.1 MMPL family transporter [Streptantibioticus ferralitis]
MSSRLGTRGGRIGTGRLRLLLWAVVVGWLGAAAALGPVQAELSKAESNDNAAFLPRSSESAQAARTLTARFATGDSLPALIVYQRSTGLTPADRAAAVADAARLRGVADIGHPTLPPPATASGAPRLVSADGTVAVTVVPVTAHGLKVRQTVDAVKRQLRPVPGLRTYVTGPAGISADAISVFSSIDFRLLAATVALVLVLLLVVYRSPVLALVPLLVVGMAYVLASGLVYLLATRGGLLVNSQATSLILILMFGAGTDYCLLLIARYQDELRRHESSAAAMRSALGRAWSSIFFSGLTVIASLAALFATRLGSTRVIAPVGIIGLGCVLLSAFTLLPALLVLLGRRAFWPRPLPVAAPEVPDAAAALGRWERIARAVLARPWWAVVGTLVLLAVGSLGVLRYTDDVNLLNAFRAQTSSAAGYQAIAHAFPAGTAAPTTMLVERTDGPLRDTDLTRATAALGRVRDIASAAPLPVRSRDGRIGEVQVVLTMDPYGGAGLSRVADIRHAESAQLPPGVRALVGGDPAVQLDTMRAADRDLRVVVPLVLAIILLILAALLRALLAPLYLIGTVIASFFGAFGISVFVFRDLLHQQGINPVEPTFAFLFLVALGVDYNIFLMARVREDTRGHDTRTAVATGLRATGSVITSAGVILAGTFAVLMVLPLVMLFQLGFTVCVGVLLDTFLVRTALVPAVTYLLGDKAWWPGQASGHRDGVNPLPPQRRVALRSGPAVSQHPSAAPGRGGPQPGEDPPSGL